MIRYVNLGSDTKIIKNKLSELKEKFKNEYKN